LSSGKKFQCNILVIISILTYTLSLSLFTIAKHHSFSTYAWDLGIFNQGFWTTTFQDKVFEYTCEKHLVESGSFFGIHFSPILFTVVPIYYLFPYPTTLLVVQSLILALSVVPVYKMAQTRFTIEQSVVISTLYLLNPALHGVNCYDFHVQAFLPLALNYLIYYTYQDNPVGMMLASNLALSIQEQVFYIILAFTGFMLVRYYLSREQEDFRRRIFLVLIILASAILWRYTSSQVIDYFNPEIPEHLKAGQHFAVLGANDPAAIPLHIVLNPGSTLRALMFQWYDKLVYLLSHFTPYLFLMTQELYLLIPTLPWFAISTLSNYPPYYRIGFQYSAYIIPFIYNGFIVGLGKEASNPSLHRKLRLVSVLIIVTSLSLSPLSPLTRGFYLSPSYQKPDLGERNQRIHEIIAMIPRDSSILTQDNLFPHISGRLDAYVMIPSTFRDVKTWKNAMMWITTRDTEYILMDLESDPHGTGKYMLDIARREGYGLVSMYDNVYLYRKDYDQPPLQYELVNLTYPVSELIPQNTRMVPDVNGTFGTVLRYYNTTIPSRTLWHGPYEVMPRGDFWAGFVVKTLNNTTEEVIRLDVYTNRTILNTMTFNETALTNDTWTVLWLNFTLSDIVYDLEFRGFLDDENTSIRLDSVQLTQTR
jgi:uncharacterized membrane protein